MFDFLLPNDIDSGHLPFMGWMLAWVWKIFGKTLWISHLTMIPWLLLLIYQVHLFSQKVISISWSSILASLLLLDPTLMAQGALISPDIILMGGFFLVLNGIWSNQKSSIFTGSILCVLASNRGAMVVAALVLWQIYLKWADRKNNIRSIIFRFYYLFCQPSFYFLLSSFTIFGLKDGLVTMIYLPGLLVLPLLLDCNYLKI